MEKIGKITSSDNSRLVNVRKIRDGKDRSHIFIEGKRLAIEAFRSSIEIEESFISDLFDDDELLEKIRKRVSKISVVSERLFKSIADTNEPQGIIFIAKRPIATQLSTTLITAKLPLVIYLNEINNPSNLGAIVRTAEAAGAAGVIVSRNSADVFSPKSIRASMGSSFRIQIWENATFDETINWAKRTRLRVIAADISAKTKYTEIDWKQPYLLVFGSEAHGLSYGQLSVVDEKFLIPMENQVESLNLGVSAGIILFEARRQIEN